MRIITLALFIPALILTSCGDTKDGGGAAETASPRADLMQEAATALKGLTSDSNVDAVKAKLEGIVTKLKDLPKPSLDMDAAKGMLSGGAAKLKDAGANLLAEVQRVSANSAWKDKLGGLLETLKGFMPGN